MLFVTGMLRSGTTLLEKLLAGHPDVSLLSQPFPFIFLEAKRVFLRTLGRGGDPYPLGDLFLERDYTPADFAAFLETYRPTREELLATFDAMETYSGQSTRFDRSVVERVVDGLRPGEFNETLAQLYTQLDPREAAWHGGKETLCEEFLPYLLDAGATCVLIIRDPRDTLASLNHGRGREFTGTRKPTLFNLRQWRKGVAFALHLHGHPRFTWMRYEDLIAAPIDRLNTIATMLGVEPFSEDLFKDGIRQQDGRLWEGNSSHFTARGLDASSIGAFRSVLPETVTAFTEAVCYPEMRALGYEVTLDRKQIRATIQSFREPYENVRENLKATFDHPARLAEELDRTDYLFEDSGEILRKAAER